MKVIRIITYEGTEEAVLRCLQNSLEPGTHQYQRDLKIEVKQLPVVEDLPRNAFDAVKEFCK